MFEISRMCYFSRDNDRSSLNCASMLKGGWWWKSCGRGLNGLYLTDPQDLTARQGIQKFRKGSGIESYESFLFSIFQEWFGSDGKVGTIP